MRFARGISADVAAFPTDVATYVYTLLAWFASGSHSVGTVASRARRKGSLCMCAQGQALVALYAQRLRLGALSPEASSGRGRLEGGDFGTRTARNQPARKKKHTCTHLLITNINQHSHNFHRRFSY